MDKPQNPLLDPNPENKFDLPHWKSSQHKLFLIKSDSHRDSAIAEYNKLCQILAQMNACSDPKEYFDSPSAQNFFFERLLPAAAKAIMRSKVKYAPEVQDILNNCLRQMIQLWLTTFSELHPGLFEMAATILDPTQPYYIQISNSNVNQNVDHIPQTNNEEKFSFYELLDSIKQKDPRIFERIHEIVTDSKNVPSIPKMALLCSIAGNLSLALPQDSARDYISKLKEAICDNLTQHANLYQDCFTKKNYKALIKSFRVLFNHQLFSNEEKHKDLVNLQLRVAKICLMSSTEESKTLGFLLLRDVIADLENPTASQAKDYSSCNKFLQDILSEMSGKGSFDKMMLIHCPRVFLYMFKNNLLEAKNLRNFWVALTQISDEETDNIWLILKKIFRRSHLCSLLGSFIEANFKHNLGDITHSDLKLLSKFFRECQYRSVQNLIVGKLGTLYCDILLKSECIKDPEASRPAILGYFGIQYYLGPLGIALPTIEECTRSLEQDITNFPFLRILCQYLRIPYNGRNNWQVKGFKLLIEHMKYFRTQNFSTMNESSQLALFSERLGCLKAVLECQEIEKSNLTYEMLNDLWQIFTEPPFSSRTYQDLLLRALHQVADSFYGLCLQHGDFVKFFRERILNKETLEHLGKSEEGAAWFQSLFIAANHNVKKIWRVKPMFKGGFVVKVEELEGYEELWSFIMSCQDQKAANKTMEFLAQIYSNLEDQFQPNIAKIREKFIARCFEHIKSSEPGSSRGLKSLKLLNKMMEETGKIGVHELEAHAGIGKVDILELTIGPQNFNTTGPLKFSIASNSTLLELLQKVAKQLGVEWEVITLAKYSYSREEKISNTQNNKTLFELGIEKCTYLRVYKNANLKRVDLFRDYNTFSQRATSVFTRLFDEFSEDGRMTPEQYTAFFQQQHITPNDPLPKLIFSRYDLDRDGYLTLDDFLKLQVDQYKENHHGAWYTFKTHKLPLRHDLREEADVDRQQTDKRSSVSYIILSNRKYLDILLSLLDCEEEEIACEAWNILKRLPTHPQVFEDIVLLKGVRGVEDPDQRDWNALLNLKSKYKLLYVLNIVEYLMYYNENGSKIPHLEELKLQEYQKNWLKDFIRYGGLDHLRGVFSLFKPNRSLIFTQPYKRIRSFAKATSSKLEAFLKANEAFKTDLSPFLKILCEYENQYRSLLLEKAVVANLMRDTLKKLRKRSHICDKGH